MQSGVCVARSVRTLSVNMRLTSVLTGGSPQESFNNVELEDHLECECEPQEVPQLTEEDPGCRCEALLLSTSLCLSVIILSLGLVVRHYRTKLNTLQDSQLADLKSQINQH